MGETSRRLAVLALGLGIAAGAGGQEPEPGAPEAVLAALQEGTALLKEKRFEDALPRLEAALGPIREHFGAKSPVLAEVLNGVGMCRHRLGHDREAEAAFVEAYSCVEDREVEGDGTPGAILRNLGELHFDKGRYEKAADSFAGAAARWERSFGAEHLLVASAQLGLGASRLKLGKQDEALEVLERCLAIVEATRSLPAEGETIESLTIVDEAPRLVTDSIAALERTLPLRMAAFGPAHPDVARHRAVLDGLRKLSAGSGAAPAGAAPVAPGPSR